MADVGRRLAEAVGERAGVTLDQQVMESYRRDQVAPGFVDAGAPAALARPRDTTGVRELVAAAARLRMPIVPRGAGSGLSGGASAIDGCLVLSLERLTDLLEIDPDGLRAEVAAGVVNDALRTAAGEYGLTYAPDPASSEFSTIGGNVATNAGGLCCVKYGVTRDALLGLEVVTADGRLVELGGRTRKNVAGYDLVSLFCGSEGTLGIVSRATVRLLRRPAPATTVVGTFPTLAAAGRAIVEALAATSPSLLEIMDQTTIGAVEDLQPMELDRSTAAILFAQSDAGGSVGEAEQHRLAAIFEAAGASFVASSDDPAEGRMLLTARKLAYPALERKGVALLDDVAVPIDRIPHFLERLPSLAAAHEVMIATFGHAGEGNMHPTVVYERDDPQAPARARSAFAAILAIAVELGGAVTGEHGVGLLKRPFLDRHHPDAARMSRAIKATLDPAGILNPGRAV